MAKANASSHGVSSKITSLAATESTEATASDITSCWACSIAVWYLGSASKSWGLGTSSCCGATCLDNTLAAIARSSF